MKKEVKICITATDCGGGVLRDVNLELNGTGRALMHLVNIQLRELAKFTKIQLPVLLAIFSAASVAEQPDVGETITTDMGAIREALGRMKGAGE